MRSETETRYSRIRRSHWDTVARKTDSWRSSGAYYHRRLSEIYRFLIPPGLRVLELGCAQGDLLASLNPAPGVGIDLSGEMLLRAKRKHPGLHFIQGDVQDIPLNQKFDFVIVSDLVNDVWDIQRVFEQVSHVVTSRSRVIVNTYSRLWELPLTLAAKSGLANPRLPQNWITTEDLTGIMGLADFQIIRRWREIMWPVWTPLLDRFFNRFLVKTAFFKHLAITNFLVGRLQPDRTPVNTPPSVSIVIPARNEAGNIPQIFSRTPELGSKTEFIFVEGHSKDDTYAVIEKEIQAHPERPAKLIRQSGEGKGDAVRAGFDCATGDILMILDADLTVPPEDLPRFYEVLELRKGEFANGVRLVYPMEKQAMRFANQIGNKFFSLAFSWLLGQPVKDTLCGTKALWKEDYLLIASNRSYFGDFDPFGDFDLIFGSARLSLKIVEVPIRYRERTYGTTNIHRWTHGWLLLRMVLFAAGKIKFI